MNEITGALGLIGVALALFVAISWILMPFFIMGTNKRLDKVNKNLTKIGKRLRELEKDEEEHEHPV